MESKIKKLLQLGIIVRSVHDAVIHYEKMLGIGPWDVKCVSGEEEPLKDLKIDGIPRQEIICKMAVCKVFGMEIELIEPVAESTYSKWLAEHGPGLHHIAVETEDGYDEILSAYQEKKKTAPWLRATGFGGLMDYSYLDFREETGLIVECYRNLEPGRTGIEPDYEGTAIQ